MNKFLVIGDSCKDTYVYGKCNRIAPDAPVPVFVPLYEKQNFGMAGNVYQNIISLGSPATLRANNVVIDKKRFVDEHTNHMFLRVDSSEENIDRIEHLTADFLKNYDIVVISDYNKGFLTEQDIQFICENHPVVLIDTKKKIGDYCKECSFIKINRNEYMLSKDFIEESTWCKEKLIVTLGSKGCSFNNKTYSVENVEIKDLCGAGDTFLASLSVKYGETRNIEQSLVFANECATKVVQMKGVNTINEFQ